MGLPGLSLEDGSNLVEFESFPSRGSSNARLTEGRIRHALEGRDPQGRLIFHYTVSHKQTWSFIWKAVSTAFVDSLFPFVAARRALYYPDSDNLTNRFRVKVKQIQLPIEQQDLIVSTQLNLEEF